MTREIRKIPIDSSQPHKGMDAYFEEIYRGYFKRLYAYARAIVDSPNVAKDVVSDFFYGLLKNKTDFRDIENIETYLFVSVKNLSVQALKKSKIFESYENLEVKLKSVEYINPEELLLEKDLLITLDELISNLPDQCQLVFNFSRKQGMKNAEIAEELGISVVTVKSQMRKALSKLREGVLTFYRDKGNSRFADS